MVGLNGPVGRSGRDLGGGVSPGGCRLSSPPLSGTGMGRTSGCQGALRFREVGVRVWAIRLSRTIRGHRPKSSLGDKILVIGEGDYKNFFREGEGKHFSGYGKDKGRKFSFSRFFCKNIGESKLFNFFPVFFQKSSKCFAVFPASGRGELWEILFPCYWGGQKLPLGGGLCFGGSSYGNFPPSPSPSPLCPVPIVRSRGR